MYIFGGTEGGIPSPPVQDALGHHSPLLENASKYLYVVEHLAQLNKKHLSIYSLIKDFWVILQEGEL